MKIPMIVLQQIFGYVPVFVEHIIKAEIVRQLSLISDATTDADADKSDQEMTLSNRSDSTLRHVILTMCSVFLYILYKPLLFSYV